MSAARRRAIDVCDERWLLAEDSIVAINPWEPHNFVPTDMGNGAIFFVLYVNRRMVRPRCRARARAAVRPHLLQAHRRAGQAHQAHRGPGLRRAVAQQPRLRAAAADRRLLRGELASLRARAGDASSGRGRHRFPRAQIHQADVGKPGRRASSSIRSRGNPGCRGRISTGCSAPRPASPLTSISTR